MAEIRGGRQVCKKIKTVNCLEIKSRLRAAIFGGLVSAACLGTPSIADACSFHNYKPSKTMVDWLLAGDTIALARPDPANSFKYKVTDFYKGRETENEIPFLVDSTARRKLGLKTNDGILFKYDGSGEWQRLAYVDDESRRLVETILSNADDWNSVRYHPARFSLFAEHQNHPDRFIRKLALQELDRVPYPMLRTMQVRSSENELIGAFWDVNEYNYQSINLLLLGMKKSGAARSFVNRQLELLKKSGNATNLGAAATALVELDGIQGVRTLENLFLLDRKTPMRQVRSIVQALAIHSELASSELSRTIERVLSDLMTRRPNSAALVARQFSPLKDWSFGPQMQNLLHSPGKIAAYNRLVIAIYVAGFRANQSKANESDNFFQ